MHYGSLFTALNVTLFVKGRKIRNCTFSSKIKQIVLWCSFSNVMWDLFNERSAEGNRTVFVEPVSDVLVNLIPTTAWNRWLRHQPCSCCRQVLSAAVFSAWVHREGCNSILNFCSFRIKRHCLFVLHEMWLQVTPGVCHKFFNF